MESREGGLEERLKERMEDGLKERLEERLKERLEDGLKERMEDGLKERMEDGVGQMKGLFGYMKNKQNSSALLFYAQITVFW